MGQIPKTISKQDAYENIQKSFYCYITNCLSCAKVHLCLFYWFRTKIHVMRQLIGKVCIQDQELIAGTLLADWLPDGC